MYETDRIMKATDEDGNEVIVPIPETPQPQIFYRSIQFARNKITRNKTKFT